MLQQYTEYCPYGRADKSLIKLVGIHVIQSQDGSVDALSIAVTEDVVILLLFAQALNTALQVPSSVRRYLMNPNLAKVGVDILEIFQSLEQYNLKDESSDQKQPLIASTIDINNLLAPFHSSYQNIIATCFPFPASIPQTEWSLPASQIPPTMIEHAAQMAALPLSVFRNYVRPPSVKVIDGEVKPQQLEPWAYWLEEPDEEYFKDLEKAMELLPESERIHSVNAEVEVGGAGFGVGPVRGDGRVGEGVEEHRATSVKDMAGPDEYTKVRQFLSKTFIGLSAEMEKTDGMMSKDDILNTVCRQAWPLRKVKWKDEKTWHEVMDLWVQLGWMEERGDVLRLVPGWNAGATKEAPLSRGPLSGAERAHLVHEDTFERHRQGGLVPDLFKQVRNDFPEEEATREEIVALCWRWAHPGFLGPPTEEALTAVNILIDLWIREGWMVELEDGQGRILIDSKIDTTQVEGGKKKGLAPGECRAPDLLIRKRHELKAHTAMTPLQKIFYDNEMKEDLLRRKGENGETPLMGILEYIPVGGSREAEKVRDRVRKMFDSKSDGAVVYEWYLKNGILVLDREKVRIPKVEELKNPLKELVQRHFATYRSLGGARVVDGAEKVDVAEDRLRDDFLFGNGVASETKAFFARLWVESAVGGEG